MRENKRQIEYGIRKNKRQIECDIRKIKRQIEYEGEKIKSAIVKSLSMSYNECVGGIGEVGIALEWHSRGQGFESPMLHEKTEPYALRTWVRFFFWLSGIQSIPSKKAEPFKMWLAQVGRERIEETIDPEMTINRALETYLKKGYSRS